MTLFKKERTSYLVKLPNWEGPLDLLLDLMKSARLKINEVSLEKITSDYLDMMSLLQEMKINQISEFTVMGATLSYIKSSRLLPILDLDDEDSEKIESVKKELVNRLIEYQKYKNAAIKLNDFQESSFFFKQESKRKGAKQIFTTQKKRLFEDINLADLVKTMHNLSMRHSFSKNFVEDKEVSVAEKIEQIEHLLEKKKKFKFSELILTHQLSKKSVVKSTIRSVRELIVTFFAILELYKLARLNLKQDANFSDIHLERRDREGVSSKTN